MSFLLACKKKETKEVTIDETPPKTTKSFSVSLSYLIDSTNIYEYGAPAFRVDTSANYNIVLGSIYGTNNGGWCGNWGANWTTQTIITPKLTYTTSNLTKPMGFYIHFKLIKSNTCNQPNPILRIYRKTIYHVFNEGDNGILNLTYN